MVGLPLVVGQPVDSLLAAPLAPVDHRVRRDPKLAGAVGVGQARGGQQHDPGPHHLAVGRGRLARPGLQEAALARPQHALERLRPPPGATVPPWSSAGHPDPEAGRREATRRDTSRWDQASWRDATRDPPVHQDLTGSAAPPAPAAALARPGWRRCLFPQPVCLPRRRPPRGGGPAAVPAAVRRLSQPVGFAVDLASRDGYQDSVLPSGLPVGTPKAALDCACGLYLNDPSAWQDHLPPARP